MKFSQFVVVYTVQDVIQVVIETVDEKVLDIRYTTDGQATINIKRNIRIHLEPT